MYSMLLGEIFPIHFPNVKRHINSDNLFYPIIYNVQSTQSFQLPLEGYGHFKC